MGGRRIEGNAFDYLDVARTVLESSMPYYTSVSVLLWHFAGRKLGEHKRRSDCGDSGARAISNDAALELALPVLLLSAMTKPLNRLFIITRMHTVKSI